MKLNVDLVKRFQEKFHIVGTSPNFQLSKERIELIQEELSELIEAFKNQDHVEVADAYLDIIFVCLGGMILHGVPNIEEMFNEVCLSNLSKSDSTHEDALISLKQYENKGVDAYIEKKSDDCYLIKRTSDDKILKSHKYTPVDLKKYYGR